MRSTLRALLLSLILFCLTVVPGAAQEPVVHAVLFYSPNCGHCQQLIQNDLPPLIEAYGPQLVILAINTSDPGGQELWSSAIDSFSIPPERWGVPMLIIGDTVLVGGFEIPNQLPGLVEAALASGGLDWPDIPGLQELLAQIEPESSPTPEASPGATLLPATENAPAGLPTPIPDQPPLPAAGILDTDPAGFVLAFLVLLALLAVPAFAWTTFQSSRANPAPPGKVRYVFPLLAILGSLVAAYLYSVESSGTLAVCGPIGDCNTVQQSSYAWLFGLIPIAGLGLLLQAVLLVLFAACFALSGKASRIAAMLLLALSMAGVLFSIYLTYLEIFVIGAVCAWCLTSALILAAQAWLAARLAGWKMPAAPAQPASL